VLGSIAESCKTGRPSEYRLRVSVRDLILLHEYSLIFFMDDEDDLPPWLPPLYREKRLGIGKPQGGE